MSKSQLCRLSILPFAALLTAILVSGCSTPQKLTQCAVCPPCATNAACPVPTTTSIPPAPAAKPLQAAEWKDLPGWEADDLSAAWPAFLGSCRVLARRTNQSRWALWRAACEEAPNIVVSDPPNAADTNTLRDFFTTHFEPYLLTNPDGSTSGLITGYYEPLLQGSRQPTKRFAQPVLGVPPDLLTIDLSSVVPELKNLRLRGRLDGTRVVPYYSRAEIVASEKAPQAAERTLFWVDDPVELFFLQIQGSGQIQLPDGQRARVGYADQNGHPYQSIGRVLIERGELKLEQASMQGIQAWARAHPDKLNALLNENPSFVFFREIETSAGKSPNDGPIGAMGIPLTARRSIAIDPRHIPLGAPVFVATTQPNSKTPLQQLMVAQDTGGAIRGVVRADFFWGFGDKAGRLAGRMKQPGQMWVLLPKGSGAVWQ